MTEVNVVSRSQRLIVDSPSRTVSVINAGAMGPAGPAGVGSGGVGIPAGGDAEEVLTKNSSTDHDAGWAPIPPGIPTGTFIQGGWDTDPLGYLILDGSTVIGGAITYPGLAACFPNWVSGSDLVLPNAQGKVLMDDPANKGDTGGSNEHTLITDNLPSHTHGPGSFDVDIDHDHPSTAVTGTAGYRYVNTSNYSGLTGISGGPYAIPSHYQTSSAKGSVNIPNYNVANRAVNGTSAATGSGTAVDHTPAHLKVRTAVKT